MGACSTFSPCVKEVDETLLKLSIPEWSKADRPRERLLAPASDNGLQTSPRSNTTSMPAQVALCSSSLRTQHRWT